LTLGISVLFDIALLNFYAHPVVALIARRRSASSMRGVGMESAAPVPAGGGS
jgi:hypothetical protein